MTSAGESPFCGRWLSSRHDVHVAGLARILPRRSVGQREGEISPAQVNGDQSRMAGRLDAIPGVGPLTATAFIAAIGNGAAFRKGREFAASVGLVPCEHSTGGKHEHDVAHLTRLT